jgi:uncharacterized protein
LPWYNAFRIATERDVLPELLFGSDYPFTSPTETMDALWRVHDVTEGSVLTKVSLDRLEAMRHRKSLAVPGLEV